MDADISDSCADFEIPTIRFYGNSKKIPLNKTLTTISQLDESDIENFDNDCSFEDDDYNPENSDEIETESASEDESDEENIPLNIYCKERKSDNKKRLAASWKRTEFIPPLLTSFQQSDSSITDDEPESPYVIFSKYFPGLIFSELAEKTNMYSLSTNGKSVSTNEYEIRKLVALHLIMGVLNYPRLRLYWKSSTQIALVRDIGITRNRFESLRNNLHITDGNDPHQVQQHDRLWKVRPLIQAFESRCEELALEENLCIDESMIPFKGQLNIKQYIRGKPTPWGIKVFMLCGESGIIYRSLVYQGSTTLSEEAKTSSPSITCSLVLHLAARIPENSGHKLFFDNYFNSISLLEELYKKGIYAAGTIRANRLEKCPIKTEKQMKIMGRGSCDYVVSDNNIVIVRWFDNKPVTLASNFIAVSPKDEAKRWDKKEKKYVQIERPAIVRMYNASMGGVDKCDFLLSLYRTFIRSKKWTLRVIFHYFNLAVCNSWLEYRKQANAIGLPKEKTKDLLEFTLDVAEALAFAGIPTTQTPKRGRPSRENSPLLLPKKLHVAKARVSDIRYDNCGHWPVPTEGHEQRCKLENCSGRSRTACEKCNIYLCLSKQRNCFKKYHIKQ